MNKHVAEELAYKNGYEKGKEILSHNFSQSYIQGILDAVSDKNKQQKEAGENNE